MILVAAWSRGPKQKNRVMLFIIVVQSGNRTNSLKETRVRMKLVILRLLTTATYRNDHHTIKQSIEGLAQA